MKDWLVAAGTREEGSPGDFYAALHAEAHRVPGCAPDAWFPEYALPERELLPAEQALTPGSGTGGGRSQLPMPGR